jgi:hypothetical protein
MTYGHNSFSLSVSQKLNIKKKRRRRRSCEATLEPLWLFSWSDEALFFVTGSRYVVQASLELEIFQLQPPKLLGSERLIKFFITGDSKFVFTPQKLEPLLKNGFFPNPCPLTFTD